MKKIYLWFQNQSLHFKMISLILLVVLGLQVLNGFLFAKIVSERLEENVIKANQVTVEQISVNFNQALVNVVDCMVSVRSVVIDELFSVNETNYVNQDIQYQGLFNGMLAENDNYELVHSMMILDSSGVQNYYYVKEGNYFLNDEQLFQKILADNSLDKQCCWSGFKAEDYFFTNGSNEKILVSIIMPIKENEETKELLLVNLETEALRRYLKTETETENLLVLQITEREIVTEEGKQLKTKAQLEELMEKFPQWESIDQINGYWVMSSNVACNSWKLSILIPDGIISQDAGIMTGYIFVITFTTGCIIVLSVALIVFMVTKPLKKMTRIMEANRHSRQMNYRFHTKYRDEVGVLAETYNKLMDEIGQLMVEIKQEQIESRKAYQRMLQMQIKPHFLYNTLETARFLVEMGDSGGVQMLEAIGKFYKLSLSGVKDVISIREEKEQIECYLQILKFRYSSKYEYSIDIQEEIMDNEIVRFSLQPLVENAVYHGIKQKRGKGFIKILGYREEQEISVVVWDNGAGIPKEKLQEIQKRLVRKEKKTLSDHIGIVNVHQRIRMHYGNGYGLHIESDEGEFTRIEVRIPLKKSKEETE